MAVKKQFSRTGKRLCSQCRRLATHEGNYHRSNGAPAKLYYCAAHAANCKDALPMAALERTLHALGDLVTPAQLCAALQRVHGVACTSDMAQDALWTRYPDKFCWSKQGYYVSREEAQAERPRIGARFQAMLDSLLPEK